VPRAAEWLRTGNVPADEEISNGRLFRVGDLAVKLFPLRHRKLRRRLSFASPAVRFCELARTITAVAVPEPVLALDHRRFGRRLGSLACYRWIDGISLAQAWTDEPAAVRALPAFLAAMHRGRVLHGDFHVYQAIWNGEQWFLIDLEGMRHPLRTLAPRRIAIAHWERLLIGLELLHQAQPDEVRPLFDDYLRQGGILMESDWQRILAKRARERARRGWTDAGG